MPTYFLSTSGNDANDGLSPASPWRSLDKLSTFPAQPGDVFLLQGRTLFPGRIDWAWKGIGNPDLPITLGSYGHGRATIQSPLGLPALHYAGVGGLHVRDLILQGSGGQTDSPKIGGAHITAAGENEPRCRNVQLKRVDASGYGMGGIMLERAEDLAVESCTLHHNTIGLFFSEVARAMVRHTSAWENDWLGPKNDEIQGGNGFAICWSQDVFVDYCDTHRNGTKTVNAGGHAGIILWDCDRSRVWHSQACGNTDPTGLDAQGIILYGCHDSEVAHCLTSGNGNAGLCFFHDEWCRHVERCTIRDCQAAGNAVDLVVIGTVLDSYFLNNRVLSTGVKAVDIAIHKTTDIRRVSFYGNAIDAVGESLLVEAVPGLTGVEGLPSNGLVAEVAEPFQVRGRGFAKLTDALSAEPIGL